ncbi:MFS transporter [Schumannella sp. 10F1B-5-1]|nr:MFS transporter [Schumannella sp. 10F1B-5-1]
MQTIVLPIQSQLPELIGVTRDDAAWVITATLVAGAVTTPIAGRLGDMYGKRRIAMALLMIQVVGAVVAALSDSLVPLIVGRALQGMAMGVIPLGISILRDVLPPRRLGTGIALVSATLGVGAALGLPLSAVIAENADWRAVFWVAAALALVALGLFGMIVPPSTLRVAARLDVPGIAGLAIGLLAVLIAVSRGGEWGWTDPRILIIGLGGLAVLVAWGVLELRVRDPLVDLRVSARPAVLLTNLASLAMGFALFASNVVFPQLLELPASTGIGLGQSLLTSSLALAPAGLVMMAMSPLAGRLERRSGPKPLLVAGAAVIAVSYAVALVLHHEVWQLVLVNAIIGVGIGLGYAAMPALIMQAVPPHETGAANGLNALMRSLGTSSAAAVIGAVLARSAVGEGTGPSAEGFITTLVIGLVASLACLVLAAVIPRVAAGPAGERTALPGPERGPGAGPGRGPFGGPAGTLET